MTIAQINSDGSVIRYVPAGTPLSPDWTELPVIDVGADLTPSAAEKIIGPIVSVTDEAVMRSWMVAPLAPEEVAAALESARASAIAANNVAAGRAREAYLTAVPGQATTYAAKQGEVTRWIAAGRPADATADAYPWAGDRAALRTVTVADVLAEWEAVTNRWEVIGRRIETERERVNLLIDAAADLPGIQSAQSSAAYPTPDPP